MQKCFPSNSWFDSECKKPKNEVNRFGHQHDIAIPKNSDTYFDLCKKYKQSTLPQGQIDSILLENKISSWKDENPPFNIKQDIANDILNSNITSCEIIHALKKIKKKANHLV